MYSEQIKTLVSYLTLALIVLGLYSMSFFQPIQTMTLSKEPTFTDFHFAGIIGPMEFTSIYAPVDGYISQVRTLFGDKVKKEQVLFVIQSTKDIDDLFSIWSTYTKARSSYQNSLFKLQGNKELFKAGLISKINLMDSEESLKTAGLELSSSEQKLINSLSKINVSAQMVEQFSADNAKHIQDILEKALEGITITSPVDGTLLFPSKYFGSGDEVNKTPVQKGTAVKNGQLIAIIANKNRLEIKIKILETNLHQIKKGDIATITGQSFPDLALSGYVYSINSQADSSDDQSASSSYTAVIRTPSLTQKQKDQIEVGMTCEIAIKKSNPPVIRIPLNAIFEKEGKLWVNLLTPNHKMKSVVVTPGRTLEDSVEITKGLSAGDQLVLPR